jgi:[NiFe] hydrogenase assembly HybE family chaperone
MTEMKRAAEMLEDAFERINRESMQDIPIVNRMLQVQALGFQEHEGRVMGVIVTPWLMNLVLLPGEGDNWDQLQLGDRRSIDFPSGSYRFLLNEIEGAGRFLAHSLYSPMHEFINQDHAVAAAEGFLGTLMVETEPEENPVDEELLGRIMRGEETPEVEMDGFTLSGSSETTSPPVMGANPALSQKPVSMSRRDLLRGNFSGAGDDSTPG